MKKPDRMEGSEGGVIEGAYNNLLVATARFDVRLDIAICQMQLDERKLQPKPPHLSDEQWNRWLAIQIPQLPHAKKIVNQK